MGSGILCQARGIEAPTRYMEFHQNIGALVKYVIAVVQQQRQPAQPPTFGFPVQPMAPRPIPLLRTTKQS